MINGYLRGEDMIKSNFDCANDNELFEGENI